MMLQIKALIADGILEGVKSIAPQSEMTAEDVLGLLEYPPDPAMGDIALPCFKLAKTLRDVRQEKHIFLYLLSFFFFIDGVYTIIDMATAYGTALGLDTTGLLLALLWTQVVAFPCAIIFGRLSAKYDTGLLIKICIVCYTCITAFGMFLVTLWQFWVLATLVGMFQGGIQALSRSYLGKIIKPERSGEFYGLMDICGKGASFLGSAVIAWVKLAGGTINIAVASLAVFFALGFIFLKISDKQPLSDAAK